MPQPATVKLHRIMVHHWTDELIYADDVVVRNPSLIPVEYLYQGAQLNLLLCEAQADGVLLPQHIVLDPDFLVDVTSICRCFTHYGDSPVTHLLQKFMSSSATPAILLGNAANQFLDDCVNRPEGADANRLYQASLRKTFQSDPLRFATIEGIDQRFSAQCREQFSHIWNTVHRDFPKEATLESAFLCEALGIQGRMDLMTTDHRVIVELKSGKGDEYGGHRRFRYEHALQMALYKESLYYNEGLPYAQVSTLLFYSRYPELMDVHLGRRDIHRAILVRNAIVHLERELRVHPASLLSRLTEKDFNVQDCRDRFYECYLRPSIRQFLQGLRHGSSLAQCYFLRMLSFVENEQFLAKTGVEGLNLPAGHFGFADTWRADMAAKLDAGRIIPDLRLSPQMGEAGVVAVDAKTTHIDESSNFRVGDMVMLYQQRPERQPACSYISCIIEKLTATDIRLRLRYPQHDTSFLSAPESLFAIEPAHADAGYTVLYRGLYAFLSAPSSRQELILGQRMPQFDKRQTLSCEIADESLRDIVLRAKQACDYFLLVGPPGTGKTSVALRQMVTEFLASTYPEGKANGQPMPDGSLLLMAFTNRAVDEICSMLAALSAPYLRLGPELSCAAEHQDHLLTNLSRQHPTRVGIRQLLLSSPMIVGTLASISSLPELFRLKHFKAAIIDEASQALEPHLLPLLCATDANGMLAIDKFILIGDHKQLPAVVVQSPSESAVTEPSLLQMGLADCRNSLFERLHHLARRQGVPEVIGLLHRQGRMHEDIARYVNQHYYEGCLDIVPLPHQRGALALDAISPLRMLAIDVPAELEHCTAKSNADEAAIVADLVVRLSRQIIENGQPLDWPHRLGIIVPFRGQITLVRRALSERQVPEHELISIDTVERYQGSQRDVIIFSTTVAQPYQLSILSQPIESNGDWLDRKLNVALTRARQQFILVGNHALLRTCEPYRQLLDEIMKPEVVSSL